MAMLSGVGLPGGGGETIHGNLATKLLVLAQVLHPSEGGSGRGCGQWSGHPST